MYGQVEKSKVNKSRAVANSVAQKKSNVKQGFGFVNNRAGEKQGAHFHHETGQQLTFRKKIEAHPEPIQRVKLAIGSGDDSKELLVTTIEQLENFLWFRGEFSEDKQAESFRNTMPKMIDYFGGYLPFKEFLIFLIKQDEVKGKNAGEVWKKFQIFIEGFESETGVKFKENKPLNTFEDISRLRKRKNLLELIKNVSDKSLSDIATKMASYSAFHLAHSNLNFDKLSQNADEVIMIVIEKWFQMELAELENIVGVSRREDVLSEADKFFGLLNDKRDAKKFANSSHSFIEFIQKIHNQEFSLDPSRLTDTREKKNEALYGYHVTITYYIPSIQKRGLDPNHRGGSTRTNTDEQQIGSDSTSDKLNVYGEEPSSLRPYILQFEDARGFTPGAPVGQRPALLRFLIPATVGFGSRGVDFMQNDAVNTPLSISPDFIEVLTSKGWLPIALVKDFVNDLAILTQESQPIGTLDTMVHGFALTGSELKSYIKEPKSGNSILKTINEAKLKGGMDSAAVKAVKLRGCNVDLEGIGNALFLGASLQTSASNIDSWDFYFQLLKGNHEKIKKEQAKKYFENLHWVMEKEQNEGAAFKAPPQKGKKK